MKNYSIIKMRSCLPGNTHRTREIEKSYKENFFGYFDIPWDREDSDWQMLYKHKKSLAVALLHNRAVLKRCRLCSNVEIITSARNKRFNNYFNKFGYKCFSCRQFLKTKYPLSLRKALKNLYQKWVDFHNQGCIITKIKET